VSEWEAIILLSRWADPHLCFPNVYICGGEMDMAVVTRARMLWEVEVKLTLADWKIDEHKRKWQSPSRRHVARFFYAVPRELLSCVPTFVPPEVGLLSISETLISEVRAARISRTAPRVSDTTLLGLMESTHHRFWRERLHRFRESRQRLRAKSA
jgi:hypothetical protein